MTGFLFTEDTFPSRDQSRVVRIPAGIISKRQLLAHLALGLDFPNYFGWNWDALEECLRDLAWIESPRSIVIVHEDLPLVGEPDEAATYVSILKDAAAAWSPSQPHDLEIAFPLHCRLAIQNSISG